MRTRFRLRRAWCEAPPVLPAPQLPGTAPWCCIFNDTPQRLANDRFLVLGAAGGAAGPAVGAAPQCTGALADNGVATGFEWTHCAGRCAWHGLEWFGPLDPDRWRGQYGCGHFARTAGVADSSHLVGTAGGFERRLLYAASLALESATALGWRQIGAVRQRVAVACQWLGRPGHTVEHGAGRGPVEFVNAGPGAGMGRRAHAADWTRPTRCHAHLLTSFHLETDGKLSRDPAGRRHTQYRTQHARRRAATLWQRAVGGLQTAV